VLSGMLSDSALACRFGERLGTRAIAALLLADCARRSAESG
jgi:hypothetical protein